MQPLCTISELTRRCGVSPRTLRYYEQIGLLQSVRPPDYAYRCYDANNAARLAQIVLLRRLRIPLRDIARLLESDDAMEAIAVFARHARGIGEAIDALETLRDVLRALIERLSRVRALHLRDHLLTDEYMRALIRALPEDAAQIKEAKTMTDLDRAESALGTLTDVRIVYLPPATVAASHRICDEPESAAEAPLLAFARRVGLADIKPDVRQYGFNHPNPVDESNAHGYEFWLTIPDDMDVPAPLVKKRFEGGLYAAHMIAMGNFHEWAWLSDWVERSDEYEYRGAGSGENMFDSLEEHLNAYTYLQDGQNARYTQLDLLIPVRPRAQAGPRG